jgi:hypothetical protein
MKQALIIIAVLTISVGLAPVQSAQGQRKIQPTVPRGSEYPDNSEKVVLDEEVVAKKLAGRILDPNNNPIDKALVEQRTYKWRKRISATFSDKNGSFALHRSNCRPCYVQITKYGFAPLLARVRFSNSGSSQIKFSLYVAH